MKNRPPFSQRPRRLSGAQPATPTPSLNIRNCPGELVLACRAQAVRQHLSLRDYVIKVLHAATNKAARRSRR